MTDRDGARDQLSMMNQTMAGVSSKAAAKRTAELMGELVREQRRTNELLAWIAETMHAQQGGR